MKDPTRNTASAKAAMHSGKCPVCEMPKGNLNVLLCSDCFEALPQETRNVLYASVEDFRAVVAELRTKRQAAALGLKVIQ